MKNPAGYFFGNSQETKRERDRMAKILRVERADECSVRNEFGECRLTRVLCPLPRDPDDFPEECPLEDDPEEGRPGR